MVFFFRQSCFYFSLHQKCSSSPQLLPGCVQHHCQMGSEPLLWVSWALCIYYHLGMSQCWFACQHTQMTSSTCGPDSFLILLNTILALQYETYDNVRMMMVWLTSSCGSPSRPWTAFSSHRLFSIIKLMKMDPFNNWILLRNA